MRCIAAAFKWLFIGKYVLLVLFSTSKADSLITVQISFGEKRLKHVGCAVSSQHTAKAVNSYRHFSGFSIFLYFMTWDFEITISCVISTQLPIGGSRVHVSVCMCCRIAKALEQAQELLNDAQEPYVKRISEQ